MIVGALFEQLFSSFWWLLPLVVLAALLKSAWFRGTSPFNSQVKF